MNFHLIKFKNVESNSWKSVPPGTLEFKYSSLIKIQNYSNIDVQLNLFGTRADEFVIKKNVKKQRFRQVESCSIFKSINTFPKD